MYMPSIYKNRLFNDILDFSFPDIRKEFQAKVPDMMKTDIRETEDGYELTVDLPGYKKENVNVELEKGKLTITASTNTENEEKDEKSSFLRRERFSGTVCRSFYVGDNLTEEDIHGKYDNGVLTINVPKIPAKELAAKKTISID